MLNNFYIEAATVFGVTFGGTFLSLIVCSQLYNRMKLQYKKEEEIVKHMKHKSLDEYYRDYEKLYPVSVKDKNKNKNKNKYSYIDKCNKFKHRYIHECTPDGGIFMKFHGDDKLFLYWSDSNIKHKYLVTCARKFCKLYKCDDLYYLDTNSAYDEEEEKYKQPDSNSDTESEHNENDFLFLKNSEKEKEKEQQEEEKEQNIKTSIRFRKEGSIRDFSLLKPNTLDTTSMTYRSFKIK